ncbi:MAG: carboxylate--amine ligase [Oscillospiraceae bacterium]|nr:carboxylate--amine ligase [Oscillospiraceae bacterium]
MKQLRYICRVLFGASFKKLFQVINRVHEKCGQNKIYTFFDILNCAVRYGAGYYDYLIFAFYDMNAKQRATYMTRVRNKRLIEKLNDFNYTHIFTHKNEFNKRFTRYLGRDFRDVADINQDDFISFMTGKDVIFAKPNVGESGKGIERLKTCDFSNLEEMYAYVKDPAHNFGVIEEQLVQHPDLNVLYPLAINSYRIVTLVQDGVAHCVYAVSKSGNEGKFVDNMENSGLCCPIDQETGKIAGCAHTSALINYDVHPYTGVTLMGFQLPFVKEAVELAKEAAMEVPEIRYVGWDVCVTPDGPAIIEGNVYPGYDFWQLPEHTPDKIGLYPTYQKLVPGYK